MNYLGANHDPDASQVVLDMTANPLNTSQYASKGLNASKLRVDSGASPKTARFSTQQLLKQSKQQLNASHNILNISNISRENIKQNTKNLQSEIKDVDEEINALRGTLINPQFAPNEYEECGDQQEDRTLELTNVEMCGGGYMGNSMVSPYAHAMELPADSSQLMMMLSGGGNVMREGEGVAGDNYSDHY